MDPTLQDYLDHMNDSPAQLLFRATEMMKKDLESGVTTCRCLGDRELVDVTCKELVAAKPESGPEPLIAIRGIKKTGAPGFVGYPFAGKKEMKQAIEENVSLGADLTKIYITGTLKNDRELESYLSFKEIKAVIEQSHRLGVKIAAHCVGGIGLDWALELDIDTVEHLYQITDRQIEKLAMCDTWAVLTPGPILTESRVRNLPQALVPGHLREKEAIRDNMAAVVKSGIPYAVGTDGMHGELLQEIRYLMEMGATPFEALSAATYHSACASGIEAHTGSLEVGKKADIVVIRGNPLKSISVLSAIKAVMKKGKLVYDVPRSVLSLLLFLMLVAGCVQKSRHHHPRISLVNSPTDIVTLGAQFLASDISKRTNGAVQPEVFHSGVLSGGKGVAEIELCQQGSIQIHITSTAYLSNLAPRTSIVSLPFMFDDLEQVVSLVKSNSKALEKINLELNQKNLAIIAWWPRGFRQLTNSRRPVEEPDDMNGLKFRVMNNQLYVDNMNAMGAHPVPMEWGEVYNGLQLKTIDGQENAEDVIYSSRLYEIQPFMTVWDYSTDLEVVMVNYQWWMGLSPELKNEIQASADASLSMQVELLRKNTEELRRKIAEHGVTIHHMDPEVKQEFKASVKPVWDKYEQVFGSGFMNEFLDEIKSY
jgi:tripartite ATP-independent transporter DctP family solute receptor